MLSPLSRPFHLVLVSPQIPPNTGNVARLCAVTGARLVLVEPLGFSIADRDLKRAGLDYWDKVFVKLYPSYGAYVEDFRQARRWLFSARARQSMVTNCAIGPASCSRAPAQRRPTTKDGCVTRHA